MPPNPAPITTTCDLCTPSSYGGLPGCYAEHPPMRRFSGLVAAALAAAVLLAPAPEQACPFVKTIVAYGISMGGNTSGLAAASHAIRHDGRPLFDYWWDIEGATNVIETYAGAAALAQTGNTFATQAQQDIEAEMGGPLEQRPDAYASHAVV